MKKGRKFSSFLLRFQHSHRMREGGKGNKKYGWSRYRTWERDTLCFSLLEVAAAKKKYSINFYNNFIASLSRSRYFQFSILSKGSTRSYRKIFFVPEKEKPQMSPLRLKNSFYLSHSLYTAWFSLQKKPWTDENSNSAVTKHFTTISPTFSLFISLLNNWNCFPWICCRFFSSFLSSPFVY